MADVGQRLLVVGASPLQVPAILKAREMGFTVAVVDRDPQAVGAGLADAFFCVSTTDASGIFAVARDFNVDGVVTMATDMPMRAVAYACAHLGLTSVTPEVAFRATNKVAMIEAFARHGVACPKFMVLTRGDDIHDVATRLGMPIIVKPVDSSGSRGVSIVDNIKSFDMAFGHAIAYSAEQCVLAEEYLCGSEVSVEMLCFNGESHVIAVTDKTTSGPPHFVELGHSQPSILSEPNREAVSELAKKAAAALGLNGCGAHAEIMLTSDGPKMIEIGARLGGDFITSHLVPLSTGTDMVEGVIRIACGRAPATEPTICRGSAVRFMSGWPPGGINQKMVERVKARSGVVAVDLATGPKGSLASSQDRLGHVITTGRDAHEAVQRCDEALSALMGDFSLVYRRTV